MPTGAQGGPPQGPRYVTDVSPADVGARVVVRHALPGGGATDVIGVLVSWTGGVLVVDARRGPVEVAEHTVLAAKRIPPAPVRRSRPDAPAPSDGRS